MIIKHTTRKHKVPWYKGEIEGTPEELERGFKTMESYLYNIINYAPSTEPIPEEVLKEERRIFSFVMQGPKAGHFRHSVRGKLTSPDVLYILSSTLSSDRIAPQFGITGRLVRDIRSGNSEEWYWEYLFVRRLKEIIKGKLLSDHRNFNRKICYVIYKVLDTSDNKELLYITSSLRKAKELRESLFNKKTLNKLLKKEELDILYPIEKVSML